MLSLEEMMSLPAIDTHVHRIHPHRAPLFGNLSGGYIPGPRQEELSRTTVFYGMVLEALRRRFGMPEWASDLAIEEERNRRYGEDPAAYFHSLIEGQNVAMYCLEIGSPLGGNVYTEEEIEYFHRSVPKEKCSNIVRIERAAEPLFQEQLSFETFINLFRDGLWDQIEKEQAIAIKSCAAYGGGLGIFLPERAQAEGAYERILGGKARQEDEKVLNHFLILESCEIAAECDIPIQFHTGEGGGSRIDFKTLSPIHMVPFLKDKRVLNRVKIVLLHGGHPHEEDTSFLVSQFENVYTDFSAMFYLAGVKGRERMAALLERAPLSKVMYGSDGVMFPEVWWFAHDWFRIQLTGLLNGLVENQYMTAARARKAARMFLYDNAMNCYTKLSSRLCQRQPK